MGELIDQFGNKQAGQLIRSEDWNGLIAGIEGLLDNVNAQIDGLNDQISALNGRLQSIEPAAQALSEQHRIALSAGAARFAIGQVATLTAQVTDFAGEPLPDLGNAANRPWVDFVTSWGELKPAPGFTSVLGTGGRAASVRVNAQGIAQVTLRAEFDEDLTDEQEDGVASALTATLPSNDTVAEAILASNTPLDAKVKGAFQPLTQAYVSNERFVRKYTDAYYLKQPRKVREGFQSIWRDYRATVMVMSRSDNDPTSPDRGRGGSSIQITFRDWIGPWIVVDFFDQGKDRIDDALKVLQPKIDPSRYGISLINLKDEIAQRVQDLGTLGRIREYRVMSEALDRIQLDQPVSFLPRLINETQGIVAVQQAFEFAQANTIELANTEAALGSLASAAAQGDVGLDELRGQLDDMSGAIAQQTGRADGFESKLDNVESSVANLNQQVQSDLPELKGQFVAFRQEQTTLQRDVGVLQGKVGEIDRNVFGSGGVVPRLENEVGTLQGQIQAFEVENVRPSKVAAGLVQIEDLNSKVRLLEERLLTGPG